MKATGFVALLVVCFLRDAVCSDVPCSCADVKARGSSDSGDYNIDPGNGVISVYCDMSGRDPITIVHHDHEFENREDRRVDGCEEPGSFSARIDYKAAIERVIALADLSDYCEQYISYIAHGSVLRWKPEKQAYGWWEDRWGFKMMNWGGAPSGTDGCGCSVSPGGCREGWRCNADCNIHDDIEDAGFLRDKSHLPVATLRFGDTGTLDDDEYGFYKLGPLRCTGGPVQREIEIPIFETNTEYRYRYTLPALDAGDCRVEFEVNANNDVFLGFSETEGEQSNLIELNMGGWGNSKTVFRQCKQCTPQASWRENGVVTWGERRGFWVDWSDGCFRLGRSGKSHSLSWCPPRVKNWKYVAFTTGYGSSGQFKFNSFYSKVQYTCEHDTAFINCGSNYINILDANYGRSRGDICPDGPITSTECSSITSRSIIGKLCHGEHDCRVEVNNGVFGDTCSGTYKYLKVKYQCVPQREEKYFIPEACLEHKCNPRGGECVPVSSSEYRCACKSAFHGEFCEHEYALCRAWGDPHYTQFNGRNFNYQGKCKYIVAQPCVEEADRTFKIVGVNVAPDWNKKVSFNRQLEVQIGGVEISLLQKKQVVINNNINNVPCSVGEDVSIDFDGKYVVVSSEKYGMKVMWDGCQVYKIFVDRDLYGENMCGLCGGLKVTEKGVFIMRNGTETSKINHFGDSWTANPFECASCDDCVDLDYCNTEDGLMQNVKDACEPIRDPNGVFAVGHEQFDPQEMYRTCIYDLCSRKSFNDEIRCDMLTEYANRILVENRLRYFQTGNAIIHWRAQLACPIECPTGSIYTICASACQPTCFQRMAPTSCSSNCVEGCEAAPSYVMENGVPIPEWKCGCRYGDLYYNVEQQWLNHDCTLSCICEAGGQTKCHEVKCAEHAMCGSMNQVHGCHCEANYIGEGTSRCLPICPSNMGNEIKLRAFVDEGQHAIIDFSRPIACEGYIRGFTIKRNADSMEPVTLIVWRPHTNEEGKFLIVGSARLNIADDSVDLCQCDSSKIPVRAGDYIGFMSSGGTVYYDDENDPEAGEVYVADYFDSTEPMTEVQFAPLGKRAYSINVILESSEGKHVEAFMFNSYLGVQSRTIPDSAMTASSSHGKYEAHQGRLDNSKYGACSWTAGSADKDQWLQVDLGQETLVIGVVSQGHCGIADKDGSPMGCVKQFHVQYSSDGQTFEYVTDDHGEADIFESRCRCQKHVKNFFRSALMTRFIRVEPVLWKNAISMRVDFIGRDIEVDEPDVAGTDAPVDEAEVDMAVVLKGRPFKRCGFLKGIKYRPFNAESFTVAVVRQIKDSEDTFELIGSTYVTTSGKDRLQRFEVAEENDRIPVKKGDYLCLIFPKAVIGYSASDDPKDVVLTASLGFDEYKAITMNGQINFPNKDGRKYSGVRPIFQVATTKTIPPVMSTGSLGVEEGQVKDEQITASSFCDAHSKAERARLGLKDQQGMTGGWCGRELDQSAFIQVDFKKVRRCGGVVTQGLSSATRFWFVRLYIVQCSLDLMAWEDILDDDGNIMMFDGNSDQDTEKPNFFAEVKNCRALRIRPMVWSGSYPALRFDILGLPDIVSTEPKVGFSCRHRDYRGSGGFTFVMPAKKFDSDGFVTGVRFMAVRRGSFRVIIFRPVDEATMTYKVVGKRHIKVKKADVEVVVNFKRGKKNRKRKKWISVKEGDMLGLSFTRSVLYKSKEGADLTDVVYSRNIDIPKFRKLRCGRVITFNGVAPRSYSVVALFKAKDPSECAPPVDAYKSLGVENGQFPVDSISVSSFHETDNPDQDFGPSSSRLNYVGIHDGAWASAASDTEPWIQVDTGAQSVFTGLITQGRHSLINWWTTKYRVAYSDDGDDWKDVKDCNGRTEFDANKDSDTPVTRFFGSAVSGRYLRIIIVAAMDRPALRFEVLGEFETAATEYGPSCIMREFIDSKNYILLAAGSPLESDGYVTEWRYFPKSDKPFKAGVWRPDPDDPTRYKHIGSSDIPGQTPNELATYRLDSMARIPFRKGDVYGWSFGEPVICYDEGEESVELLYSGNGGNLEPTPVGQYRKFVSSGKQAYSIGASVQIVSTETVPALACMNGLGMDDDTIPDKSIETSSVLGLAYGNSQSRLNAEATATLKGCWAPAQNKKDEYVQVDLGKPTVVTGVSIQGCNGEERWVTKFKVELSMDKKNWKEARNKQGGTIFYGNSDSDSVVQVFFKKEVKARLFRISVEEWKKDIGLRFDILGCPAACETEWGCKPLVRRWKYSMCDKTFVVNTQHPLTCNSYIKGWRMIPRNKAPVTFYVLKPINLKWGKFKVVGKTFVPRRKKLQKGEVYEILLESKDWIEARSGHMIGFTSRYRSPIHRDKKAHDRSEHMMTRNKKIKGYKRLDIGDKFRMRNHRHRKAAFSFTAILTQEGMGGGKEVPPVACVGGIGMENGAIPDESILVTSSMDPLNNGGAAARLLGDNAWIASPDDPTPYIQINFGYRAKVTGISTQGDPTIDSWVTSYSVEYSDSCHYLTKEPQNFQWVKFTNTLKDIFAGNSDQNTVETRFFKEVIEAQVVRVWPLDFHNHAAMRLDFLGCSDEDPCSPNPCKNGAICRKTQASFGYTCICPVEWGGKNCDIKAHKCCAYGDPHYCNFEGKKFNFQGHCEYILARTLTTTALEHFTITADNVKSQRRPSVSTTKEVYVKIGDKKFDFKKNRAVYVNGELITCPYEIDGVTVSDGGNKRVILRTDFGLTVSWDGRSKVDIFLTEDYMNQVEGLCGNYNGDNSDDFILRSTGELTTDREQFGESWGADPTCEKCTDCQETDICRLTERLEEAQDACKLLNDRNGPFTMCIAAIKPVDYFENCLYDFCALYPTQDNLCEDIQKYADECIDAGLQVGNWRRRGFCYVECPVNMVFSQIGTMCPDTCGDMDASKDCTGQAGPMCVCMPGLYLEDGNRCVEDAQCGCTYQGVYHKNGLRFMADDCSEICTCNADHEAECEEVTCNAHATCQVEDGVRGCNCNDGWSGDGMETCEEILEPVDVVVCEDDTLTIDCSASGELIDILTAVYSTEPRAECPNTADNAESEEFRYAKTIIRDRCHKHASCTVPVSSLVFGNFGENAPKSLYVRYQCREVVPDAICHPDVELISCQGSDLEIQCGDEKIDIISANFGRRQGDHMCSTDDNEVLTQDCFAPSALNKMVEACHLSPMCTINTIPETFGSDPCPNTNKYLRIHYQCNPSPDPRELEEDKCEPNPCVNGVCEAISIEPKYNCKCNPGFTGQHCDIGTATCKAHGDPHYITFDGKIYSYMGHCKYTLVKNADGDVPDFEVVVYNQAARRNPAMSSTVHVQFNYFGEEVHMYYLGKTFINGIQIEGMDSPEMKISVNYPDVVIETQIGVTLRWDGKYMIEVDVTGEYYGHTEGLCGTYNGNPEDDFLTPFGETLDPLVDGNIDVFGDSWLIPDPAITSCDKCEDCDRLEPCSDAAVKDAAQEICNNILSDSGPFQSCHDTVPPIEYFKNCVVDRCTMPDGLAHCDDYQAYAEACRDAGIIINWRRQDFCFIDCLAKNMVYSPVSPACPATCANPMASSTCNRADREDCVCPSGMIKEGETCIDEERCGCVDQETGFYYRQGETFMIPDCSRVCSCAAAHDLQCVQFQCPPHEVCGARDASPACICDEGYFRDTDSNTCEAIPVPQVLLRSQRELECTTITCGKGFIDVLDANFGPRVDEVCLEGDAPTDCNAAESRAIMRNLCQGRGTCQLDPTTVQAFGEPCFGALNYIFVNFACTHKPIAHGEPRSLPFELRVCQDSSLYLACREEEAISIKSIFFGRRANDGYCLDNGSAAPAEEYSDDTAMNRALELCAAQSSSCILRGNDFGDPCKTTKEYLEVSYSCVPKVDGE